MEIKYKNTIYDLDIDALTDFVDGNGYHHYMYDFGAPEFKVLSAVVKENITEITVLRTQELKDFEVYIDDKCGIYNLKAITKELLKLDNKYIDEAISKGGSVETKELTFKILSEEYSNIEYVSGDKFKNKDIESYMSIEEDYEEVVLLVHEEVVLLVHKI